MNLYLYLIYIKDFGNENESKTAVIEEQRVEFPKMLHFYYNYKYNLYQKFFPTKSPAPNIQKAITFFFNSNCWKYV